MFYLGMALISLTMSTANMIYTKTGEIYKARKEFGERRDSELEQLGKKKYEGLDSSSEGLELASRKGLPD